MTQKDKLDQIFLEWSMKAEEISLYFKNRDRKSAREPMLYFLKRFLEALFIGNGYSDKEQDFINWKEELRKLKHLPVNAEDRLHFVEEQPDHYQSFIQLSELFSEWQKKSVILLRRST